VETLHILLLALVQGITEFLPISSSAHLILAPRLFQFPDQGLDFDIAVHLGSLLAVLVYFRREIGRIGADLLRSLGQRRLVSADARLGWMLILATLPVVVIGAAFKAVVQGDLRSPLVIALATIVFGLLLWWFDVKGKRRRDEYDIGVRDALIIGLMQALAIIPGTSRAGITITAGLMLGLSRAAASRFSFLLAIPTISMSSVLAGRDLWQSGAAVQWNDLFLGVTLSALAAYLCIHYFLRLIERVGMLPFVLYRLALGALILVLLAR
jgi:undecaprenyl-diphosphatase